MGRWGYIMTALALVIASIALWRTFGDRRGDAAAALDRRVAVLERQGRARPLFAPALAAAPSRAPESASADVKDKMEQLHQRLALLEGEAEERRRARVDQDRRKQDDLRWARVAIIDRAESPDRRLKALKMLRSADERSHEVAMAALELLRRDDVEPDIRSDLISELKGVTFAELKAPMLDFLASGHEDTRHEAVQVLSWFFDDPAVVAAVTRLRDQDPAAGVRRSAAKRLDDWRAGKPPAK
jgi:hypothetical protein